jgi:cytochrome c oxidase assembly protein subunit 11
MQDKSTKPKNNKKLLLILIGGVLFMFGFCYMLVPLYTLMCKQLGINGKGVTSATAVASAMQVDKSRVIKVGFSTTTHGALAFKFIPLQHYVTVHPGEMKLVYFLAENNTGHGITVQAIPSITPADGARFFKKTECFCFTQQFFKLHEKAKMPVIFFIDPAVPREIKEVTLSYTMFDASGFVNKNQQHYTTGRIELN